MTAKNSNPFGVKAGEVWVENDPRHPRKLKITKLLARVSRGGFGYAELENVANGNKSVARLDRFNGKRGGYFRAGEPQ
jgi:hypothetical protein